jgi:site-specific DNA-methyltransferase (adenine-specific)
MDEVEKMIELKIGDCLEILKEYPDNYFDLVLTDPPYGIGESGKKHRTRRQLAKPNDDGSFNWDQKLTKQHLDEIIRVSKNHIIFGGNYYADWLPASSCWIVWDKKNTGDFADCEIAWTSFKSATRIFRYKWNGMLQENMKTET